MKLKLHQAQSEIFQDSHRFKIVVAGRRFGKTTLSLAKIIHDAARNDNKIPQAFYWYIAPTFRQAKDIAWKILNDLCEGWNIPGEANESELTRYVNGIPIKLMGADNMPRLKGVALYGVICDEYASWKNGRILEEAIMPTLQDTNGWMWAIGTPSGYNFFYDLYEYAQSGQDKDFKAFHFTSYDNPLLKQEELEKTKVRTDETIFAQEYMAEFKQVSGAIWKDFTREYHTIEKYNPTGQYPIYASIDFGFAIGHATSFLLHEVTPTQIKTFDGFNEYEKDPQEVLSMVEAMTKGIVLRGVYCDSARPDLIAMLKKARFPTFEADKDVELGVAKVAEYMKIDPLTTQPKWVICNHLKDAIRQIENYQWEEVRSEDGKYKKVPKKFDEDACDSIRYFIYTFEKPRKDLDEQARRIFLERTNEDF